MIKTGKFIYIPALSNAPNEIDKYGFTMSWWRDSDHFIHPWVLASYWHFRHSNAREVLKYPKEYTMVADSGGVQMLTMGVDISPKKVMEWQEKNSDMAFILDHPAIKKKFGALPGQMDKMNLLPFDKCLEKTITNTRAMLEARTTDKLKLYAVVHGTTFARMEQWYKEVRKLEEEFGYEFDGWAFSPATVNIEHVVKSIIFALEHVRDKPVHYFATSGFMALPIVARYTIHTPETTTIDSTTYLQGMSTRRYILGTFHLRFGKEVNLGGKMTALPCDCPVCILHSTDDLFEEGTVSGRLMSLHNLYYFNRHFRRLHFFAKDEEALLGYVRTLRPLEGVDDPESTANQTMRALQAMFAYEKREGKGWDYIKKKERSIMHIGGINEDIKSLEEFI